jgi:sugar phosphate permease
MNKLLFAVMTAFGRVFLVTLLFGITSIDTSPNQTTIIAFSWAGFVASIVAGLRAIQIFIPGITFARFFPQPWAAWIDAFSLAFLAVFSTLLTGWLAAPDYENWKATIAAIIVGAFVAGVRALQGLATPGDKPTPAAGIANPEGNVKI